MDNSTKTPVTKLQEYLTRHGTIPQYELIESGMGIHNGTFKYLVTARGIRAVGAGRSKKEAKHEAARNALVTIAQEGSLSPSQDRIEPDKMALQGLGTPSPDPDDLSTKMEDLLVIADTSSSTRLDTSVGNCVGELQDLCMANELPLATYELTGDVGPPHNKQFTYECQLMMQTIEGVSRTKKHAKQLAAHKLITKLNNMCGDLLCTGLECRGGPNTLADLDKPCESYKEVINRYKELGSNLHTTKPAPLGLKVSEYHNALKHLDCIALRQLKDKTERYSGVLEKLADPRSVLKEIMDQLECVMSVQHMQSSSVDVKVLLVLGTSPEAVLFGSGDTEETAIQAASRRALRHLLLMTH